MTKKAWIIFALMCIALIGGLVALRQHSQIDVSNVNTSKPQPASSINGNIGDHV